MCLFATEICQEYQDLVKEASSYVNAALKTLINAVRQFYNTPSVPADSIETEPWALMAAKWIDLLNRLVEVCLRLRLSGWPGLDDGHHSRLRPRWPSSPREEPPSSCSWQTPLLIGLPPLSLHLTLRTPNGLIKIGRCPPHPRSLPLISLCHLLSEACQERELSQSPRRGSTAGGLPTRGTP